MKRSELKDYYETLAEARLHALFVFQKVAQQAKKAGIVIERTISVDGDVGILKLNGYDVPLVRVPNSRWCYKPWVEVYIYKTAARFARYNYRYRVGVHVDLDRTIPLNSSITPKQACEVISVDLLKNRAQELEEASKAEIEALALAKIHRRTWSKIKLPRTVSYHNGHGLDNVPETEHADLLLTDLTPEQVQQVIKLARTFK